MSSRRVRSSCASFSRRWWYKQAFIVCVFDERWRYHFRCWLFRLTQRKWWIIDTLNLLFLTVIMSICVICNIKDVLIILLMFSRHITSCCKWITIKNQGLIWQCMCSNHNFRCIWFWINILNLPCISSKTMENLIFLWIIIILLLSLILSTLLRLLSLLKWSL
jgi:hypothetical protein